jgi:S-adenosylmethionine:tRNA ribosyltransferase-isomerase
MTDRLSDYDFSLPEDAIARRPLEERRQSRLLILKANAEEPQHGAFEDVVSLLNPGDALVLNDTRVLPARLFAAKAETGGKVQVLLSRPAGADDSDGGDDDGRTWICLVKARRPCKSGGRLVLGMNDGMAVEPFFATLQEPVPDEPGAWRVRFDGDVVRFAQAFGELPLPPYLDRSPDAEDDARYQTVYAHPEKAYAAAAPTAGLHFDEAMLETLEEKGVRLVRVTLHVGPGTFLPVREEDLSLHKMHAEPFELSAEAAQTLNHTLAEGGRIVAVGTTALRVLETAWQKETPHFSATSGLTRIFIRPGNPVHSIDALVTNFHLPKSTLLMLVAAVAGKNRILNAYQEAIDAGYRFFSYGDASYLEVRRDDVSDAA